MPVANRQPSPLASRIASVPRRHDDDYPLWQGPCGDGPNGGITQSMLVRFLSCRERFRLKYVLGLEPHERWSHRLGYGNMWHVCEEQLAASRQSLSELYNNVDAALHNHRVAMRNQYPMQSDEIDKWWWVCSVQFPEYVKYWSDHPDVLNRTPLLQEQVFDVPYYLPSGRTVRLRGKWDSVDLINAECNCGADRTGPSAEAHDSTCPAAGGARTGIYLQENKTKGDIDKMQVERQLKFDLQTMMYLIALERWGSEAKRSLDKELRPGMVEMLDHKREVYPINGVRYNVIRRPLSGGVGTIRPHKAKATKTKTTPAETDEQFYERLRRDYIADDPAYWFFRVRAEVSDRDVEVFRRTCLDPILEQLCWWYDVITNRVGAVNGQTMLPSYAANYRTPFGVYSALEEGGATEYDAYLATGSEAGLRRTDKLFTELQ